MALRHHNFGQLSINEFYRVPALAKTVGVTPKTVRYWIKHRKLPVLNPGEPRPIISGEAAKEWANKIYEKQKWGPIAWNQFCCLHCKKSVFAVPESVDATEPGKAMGHGDIQKMDVFGCCVECGRKVHRFSTTAKAMAIFEFYWHQIKKAA